jgi:tRNA-2-methylthio-N6-dimethylallyladenosine synthase
MSYPSGASGKYFLATFGCQMNVYDSNLIGGMLEKKGMAVTGNAEEADVLIVNTCSIRGGAEDRAYARIASMRHYKRR